MGAQISAAGGTYDPNVDPGNVNPPAIFEPSTSLTGGSPQVWVAASGGANWGGCLVSLSFDGANFDYIGTITASAFQGVLTSALSAASGLDTTNMLAIDLTESAGIMPTAATHADADAFRTLCYVCPAFTTTAPGSGEVLAYGAVSATGTYTNDLTYLQRGLYGTTGASHASGDFFTRVDIGEVNTPPNSVVSYTLPTKYIGATLSVKLQSFNVFGNALEDISTVTEYTYTPSGQGYGGGAGGVPTAPTAFTATLYTYTVGLNWADNPAADNVTSYLVQRKFHLGVTWSTIAKVTASAYNDSSGISNTAYDYQIIAVNAAGNSSPSSVQTITTNANFN
ncbi:MAG TPA: fibronectin type III domain-containing protein [Rhizomicrobium sp.]|jgi:hypothetical protein